MDGLPIRKKQPRPRQPADATTAAELQAQDRAKLAAWAQREVLKAYMPLLKRDPEQLRFWGRQLLNSALLANTDVDQLMLLEALQTDMEFKRRYQETIIDEREAESQAKIAKLRRQAATGTEERPDHWFRDLARAEVVETLLRNSQRSGLERFMQGLGAELAADIEVNGPITQAIHAVAPHLLARFGFSQVALPTSVAPTGSPGTVASPGNGQQPKG